MLNDSSSEGNYNAEPDPFDEILDDSPSEESPLYTQQIEPMDEILS